MNKAKRLTDYFLPLHYDIDLSISDDYQNFSGNTTITGTVVQDTNKLYLHFNGPTITKAEFNGRTIETSANQEAQEITLNLPEKVTARTEIKLNFSFEGPLSETMEGIYRSAYMEKNKDKIIVSTQFESTHAREVFPCVDEPLAKATFDLKLNTPKVPTIIANTPIKSSDEKDGRLVTTFETTPVMSTYLLAFVIGDLSKLTGKTSSDVEVNVFATHENQSRLPFSLDVAIKCLDFFEDYFGIKYPLAKLDMVAIPEFASGAMENWGLVTYRETAMLFDDANSSLTTKRRVIEVITHELAHQWFGNLVTMEWWDDLWLNESFATFMSFMCSNALFPELGFDELFMEEEFFPALHADSNSHTTAIYAPLEDPRDINEHFDPAITYGKGAAVLRMLHNYIGGKSFRTGLSQYLESKQYANAVGADLWRALTKSSGKPVDEFMQKWIKQPGYPLVKVTNEEVAQSRYYESPLIDQPNTDSTWPVDLSHSSNDGLFIDGHSLALSKPVTDKLNRGQFGVYRVLYSNDRIKNLAKQVSQPDWSNVDRMGLLDDTHSLAKAGILSTDLLLNLLSNYKGVANNAVWDVVSGSLSSTVAVFGDEALRPKFNHFGQNLLSAQYERLSWEQKPNESPFDTLLRPIIIGMASKYRNSDAIKTANQLFVNNTDINPNLRGIVYSTVARDGNEQIFDSLLKLHNQTNLSEEKRRFAGALCSFEDEAMIKRAIKLIRSEHVRIQEVISWVFGLYQNRYSRDLIWQWQKDNWDWIHKTFGRGHLYSYFAMGLGAFNDDKIIDDIEEFFADKSLTGIKRTLEQSLEQIRIKSAWRQRDYNSVAKFLTDI